MARVRVTDVTVVVPAHDEQDWLGGCLTALEAAAAQVDVPVHVVVVLDACDDGTADVVPPGTATVEVAHRNVGAARAAGFAAARRGAGSWFATTDADSRVPADWLVRQLEAAQDHDVYAGTVRVADWAGRAPGTAAAHGAAYSSADGHRHAHGANLGISAAAYDALGGFAPLAVHEDADLLARARGAGLRIAWVGGSPVTTSARVSHRTPGGFSATLDRLDADATHQGTPAC